MEPTTSGQHERYESPGEKLTLNERLAIMLKEYDVLRKEAEQSLSLMPEIGKSIGLVIAGALIGAHETSLGKDIALCALPVIVAALGAAAHTYATLETTSRRLMGIEDRVFQMAGEALLTHETRMNIRRIGSGGKRWMLTASVGTVLYLVITVILYCQFHDAFPVERNETWITLYWILVGAAVTYAVLSTVRIGRQRRDIPRTRLLELEEKRGT
jgi:hypothetical protein